MRFPKHSNHHETSLQALVAAGLACSFSIALMQAAVAESASMAPSATPVSATSATSSSSPSATPVSATSATSSSSPLAKPTSSILGNHSLLAQDTPALREYMDPLGTQSDLNPILNESEQTFGVSFLKPEEVVVQKPALKALIQLNSTLSPYELDAKSAKAAHLGEVLKAALSNNLDIRLHQTDVESSKWNYYGALGNFLPTFGNSFTYETLNGKYASPFGLQSRVSTPHMTIPTAATFNLFRGGALIYGARQTKHLFNASKYSLSGTTNDVLMETTNLYYNLVLNDILLQIRIKAVETSAGLLARNEDRFANGASTKLDVLQAKSQLSRDRQALISQQVARRQAAIALSTALNADPSEDWLLENRSISKVRLVDGQLPVGTLLQIAIDNRPELKKYEQLRLAAKDAVKVAFSQFLPQVTGTVGGITTAARTTSGGNSSSAQSSSASGGALSAGGLSSGTAAPSGGGSGAKRFTPVEAYQLGVTVQWNFGGMGVIPAAQVQSARWQARKAQLEFSRELAFIYKDVRDSYLNVLSTENLISETTDTVNATREQLSVANVRLDEGVGTDIDALNAQREYTQAMIDKASAIINFNVAEAKLLRAIGRVSFDTLTTLKPLSEK